MHRVYDLNLKNIQRNPSIEVLETLIRLPKIKKEFIIKDKDFMIEYKENRNRVKVKYTSYTKFNNAGEL
jgi:hypothetical protein